MPTRPSQSRLAGDRTTTLIFAHALQTVRCFIHDDCHKSLLPVTFKFLKMKF